IPLMSPKEGDKVVDVHTSAYHILCCNHTVLLRYTPVLDTLAFWSTVVPARDITCCINIGGAGLQKGIDSHRAITPIDTQARSFQKACGRANTDTHHNEVCLTQFSAS